MSFLSLTADAVTSAAQQWEAIGSALTSANSSAAGSTTGLAAMAADDVSAAVRSLFAEYGQAFQAASAQAAAFHSQLVSSLNGGVAAYLSTEIANVQQGLASAVSGAAAPVPASFSWGFGAFSATLDTSVSGNGSLIGSLSAVPGFALGVDAVGPPLSAANAFANSLAAVGNAARTGDPLGALIGLLNTPANVGNGLLFGQGSFAVPVAPPPGLGFASATISVPYGGLLAPVQPASLMLTSPTGAPTVVPLAGPEFGGLLPAVQAVLHKPYFGLGLLVPAV
ncbi:PE family protein [Mycobacterium sp. E796]|uniref:PE family protein n=1 Tax=Mycobacterium sp. E796 TaxID=1834151 RepID=UPI0007FEB9C8|nr:PE family protein [Mycobacterium sp. E796]OBI46060.1 hypothetical protein A5706_30490 [Mycobacterium sp. E796]